MSLCAKYGANRTYRYDAIQFLVKFTLSSAAILDFEKFHFGATQCLGGSKMKLQLKFYGNRTTGFEVIQVFVNLNIAAPPSWIPLFSNFWPIFSFNVISSMLERNLVHVA